MTEHPQNETFARGTSLGPHAGKVIPQLVQSSESEDDELDSFLGLFLLGEALLAVVGLGLAGSSSEESEESEDEPELDSSACSRSCSSALAPI